MNVVNIIVQTKDDPNNLLGTKEMADKLNEGLTVVFIESATQGGQIGVEFIFKGRDIYGNRTIIGSTITENNFEGIMGGFIGVRMRFGRMPQDQWEIVRHYVKQSVTRFIESLPSEKRKLIEEDLKKYFRI